MQDSKKGVRMAKRQAKHFVFCALPLTGKGCTVVVYIGTRADWEKRGCLSDGYTKDERKKVEELCDKYGLVDLMESTYESTARTPTKLNKLIAQEPDFAYDAEFAAFIKSSGSEWD